jgi:hypothetical protein
MSKKKTRRLEEVPPCGSKETSSNTQKNPSKGKNKPKKREAAPRSENTHLKSLGEWNWRKANLVSIRSMEFVPLDSTRRLVADVKLLVEVSDEAAFIKARRQARWKISWNL